MKLNFSPEANDALDQLEQDPSNNSLCDAVWDTLDVIATEPDSARARRRVLRTPKGHSVWMVPVPNRHRENPWVILWQPRDGEALIAYIGPEDFNSER